MYNGEKIRQILREKGIRQKDLMEAMGWKNSNQVRQIVEGNPRADILEGVCDFLQIPIDTLFVRTDFRDKSNIEVLQAEVIEQQKKTIDALHEYIKAISR